MSTNENVGKTAYKSRSMIMIARDNNLAIQPSPNSTQSSTRFSPPSVEMVSTRQASKQLKSREEDRSANSGDEYEEKTPEHGKARGKKRARATKVATRGKETQKRRKKGKLSMLPEMPVDILYEVCTPPLVPHSR
jgi:hypothetical protein